MLLELLEFLLEVAAAIGVAEWCIKQALVVERLLEEEEETQGAEAE